MVKKGVLLEGVPSGFRCEYDNYKKIQKSTGEDRKVYESFGRYHLYCHIFSRKKQKKLHERIRKYRKVRGSIGRSMKVEASI